MDQIGIVAPSTRGQLNRENVFPCFCSRLRIWSPLSGRNYNFKSMDQIGIVAPSTRGQLNRENVFPCFCSRLRIWSPETDSAVLYRASLLVLHTQADEFGAHSRDSSRFPRRRPPSIQLSAIGSVLSLSGHAIAHRWRSVCVCVCFLPIHSGHQVRWTYQPGSHRRKVTQDF